MSDTKSLTRNQRRAITALLEHPTIGEAAAAVGVNPKTISRWLDESDFRSALHQAEGAAIDLSTRRLLLLADKAISALDSVLDDPEQGGATNKRLAAVAVLDHLMRLRELHTTEQRLENLELATYGKINR